MKILDLVAFILLIVGGLNWGLVGLADFNLVTALFGATIFTKLIYILVGVAAVYKLFEFFKCGGCCSKS